MVAWCGSEVKESRTRERDEWAIYPDEVLNMKIGPSRIEREGADRVCALVEDRVEYVQFLPGGSDVEDDLEEAEDVPRWFVLEEKVDETFP